MTVQKATPDTDFHLRTRVLVMNLWPGQRMNAFTARQGQKNPPKNQNKLVSLLKLTTGGNLVMYSFLFHTYISSFKDDFNLAHRRLRRGVCVCVRLAVRSARCVGHL